MENEKKYLRLKKIADLQEYAKRSDVSFLIGGDYHVARIPEGNTIIDLQELNTEEFPAEEGREAFAAFMPIESLLERAQILSELRKAAELEGGLNLRNSLSLGNYLRHGHKDGPLKVALAALNIKVSFVDGFKVFDWAEQVTAMAEDSIPLVLYLPKQGRFVFESVGRSPKDKPLLAIAVYQLNQGAIRVAVSHPALGVKIFTLQEYTSDGCKELEKALQDSGDSWAGADYRIAAGKAMLSRALARLTQQNQGGV